LEEKLLKYMIEYKIRSGGITLDESFAGSEALITAFSKWKPEDGLTVHAFVSDLAAVAGYVLVEADDPKVIVSFVSKYNFWNDVKVVPVVDVGEVVPISAASLAWARSASKG
jgi:Protein of unknown function (DUF3303)